jgi:hypothetical protein
MFSFKNYKLPIKIENEEFLLDCIKENGRINYKRKSSKDEINKILIVKSDELVINPITTSDYNNKKYNHLLIKFKENISLEDDMHWKFYLTFPISIGVFIENEKNQEIIDSFSFNHEKYTLYGDQTNGIICNYWESNIFSEIPEIKKYSDGILEVNINNQSGALVNLTNLVFDFGASNLFYDDTVRLNAKVRVLSEKSAETSIEAPNISTLRKALDIFSLKRNSSLSSKFLMENGI